MSCAGEDLDHNLEDLIDDNPIEEDVEDDADKGSEESDLDEELEEDEIDLIEENLGIKIDRKVNTWIAHVFGKTFNSSFISPL